ncbi:CAMK family protein kinase [Tritrichomonas foetus]|uniref:Serine/threonine-protein kinase PLK n=1 Tax=Tritrichomonas foetus TaxID=1144522 RepID=A0A1J4KAY0_9EUKA|nr:CAMK family protein kinase [Tritrichomonas foetus]|eukprot:OHT06860.1 CAMK family protein kinase [Tritrichomonas foetus]
MQRPVCVPLTLTRRHEDGTTSIFRRHEELGRGGFAAVYRVTETNTGKDFALKAISRDRVAKPKSLEKLKSEISIQRSLDHPNILKSFDSFEDSSNYYILIELCPGHSVKDLVKRSGHLSEAETARILRDVMAGLCYLHDNRIIHRDLKLENFLVGSDGKIKIADFGLSAKLDYDDERKYTVCGTPNYLSPELLTAASKGHSYEVDIWTIGVCAFAMLTGHPPFETTRTKLTYEHIKNCQYHFPTDIRISPIAKDFVRTILQLNPERRPNAQDVSLHPFLALPKQNVEPKAGIAPYKAKDALKPRNEVLKPRNEVYEPIVQRRDNIMVQPLHKYREEQEEITVPKHCVARFCDHSDKYGLGYMLIDGTVGACFNDLTRMVMDPFETFVQYWDNYQTVTPQIMDPKTGCEQKKLSLLRRFSESLKKTKSMYELPAHHYSQTIPMRHVKYWMRNNDATLFRMDDRNIQVNFNDRTKVVIFWNSKKMIMIHSIKETGKLLPLNDVNNMSPLSEERKRFSVAKAMLAEMSGKNA